MNTKITFTGIFNTHDGEATAEASGTIYLRVEPTGMKSWYGYLIFSNTEGDMPIMPQGILTLDDGRKGKIMVTNRRIDSDSSESEIAFDGSGPLA